MFRFSFCSAVVRKFTYLLFFVSLALTANVVLANVNIRVEKVTEDSISISWRAVPGVALYFLGHTRERGGDYTNVGETTGTSYTFKDLRPYTWYRLNVDFNGSAFSIVGRTAETPVATKERPRDITCPILPAIIVVSGYGEDTQCKQVGEAGVAIPELMARGILDAVDVFGTVDAEMRVCFRQQGRLKFLDATTMPRAVTDLAAEYTDGMTCGRIDRIGTVVLLQASETQAGGEADTAPVAAVSGAVGVNNCQLTTTDYLSLRGGPSVMYARKTVIPRGARLLARARNSGWYLVEYQEQVGWISGEFAEASAGCEGIGSSESVFLLVATEPTEEAIEKPVATPEQSDADAAPSGSDPPIDCRLTTGDIINLRERPGLENEILAEIPFKTGLIATERAGDWFQVEYEGIVGWVNIDYVFRSGICG